MHKIAMCRMIMCACVIGIFACYVAVAAGVYNSASLADSDVSKAQVLPLAPSTGGESNFQRRTEGFSAWFPGREVEHAVVKFQNAPLAQSYMAVDGKVVYWMLTGFKTPDDLEGIVQLLIPKHLDDHFCDRAPCRLRHKLSGEGWQGVKAPIQPNYMDQPAAQLLVAQSKSTPVLTYAMLVINGTPGQENRFFNSLKVDTAIARDVASIAPEVAANPGYYDVDLTTAAGRLAATTSEVVIATAEPVRSHQISWLLFCTTLMGIPGVLILVFIGASIMLCMAFVQERRVLKVRSAGS